MVLYSPSKGQVGGEGLGVILGQWAFSCAILSSFTGNAEKAPNADAWTLCSPIWNPSKASELQARYCLFHLLPGRMVGNSEKGKANLCLLNHMAHFLNGNEQQMVVRSELWHKNLKQNGTVNNKKVMNPKPFLT